MTRRLISSAAVVLACAAGAGLAAQSRTPQTPPAPASSDATARSAQDNRVVTATGCLRQHKDLPATARTSAGNADDFVLIDARIVAAGTAEPSGLNAGAGAGTSSSGSETPETRERARTTMPGGAPGSGGAGTSGTGSTSVQTTDKRPSEAASVPSSARGSQSMYKIAGLSTTELREHVNQHVELEGRVNVSRMSGAAARQPGAAIGQEPASTPSASAPAAQAPTAQGDRRGELQSGELPELQATSIKASGMKCQGT